MTKEVTEMTKMKTFRVYFRDGNWKLLEAENMYNVVAYVFFVLNYEADDVVKIEEC